MNIPKIGNTIVEIAKKYANKTTEYLVHKLLLGGRVVLVGACVARENVH